jgi:succinate dehydrogenase/fumarate reductase flavoprotein subunit
MTKILEQLDEPIETDILVIGGGLAGCMAAIEASDRSAGVVLAVEGKVGKSGCTPLGGGPGGADFMVDSASVSTVLNLDDLGPEKPDLRDSPELFKEDVLQDGEFLNNQKMLDVYVAESPKRMKKLIDMGLRIIEVTSAHNVRFPRGVIALNRDISSTLIKNVSERPITILEDTKITDLLTIDDRCVGAVGIRINSGKILGVKAKAVIIATGGWQMAFNTGGSDELTGDGQAMALRAGAELVDMEFSTYMDRYLIWPPFASRDNFIWDWDAERRLANKFKKEILSDVPPENRRRLSLQRISKEISEGRASAHGGVYLQNPEEVLKNGYIKMKDFLEAWDHEDLEFELSVGSHYFNGGVKVNERTETALKGLYAAGEASGGLFGARRIASALSEATIQGAIAAENAVEFAKNVEPPQPSPDQIERIKNRLLKPLEKSEGIKPVDLRKRIKEITLKSLCLYRERTRLEKALDEFRRMRAQEIPQLWVSGTKSRRFNKEWIECISLDSLLICLEGSTKSALMREESRGHHIRIDYPLKDDENWLKNITIKKIGDEIKATADPIIVTTMPPRGD